VIRTFAVLLLAGGLALAPRGRLQALSPVTTIGPRFTPSATRTVPAADPASATPTPEAIDAADDPPVYRYGLTLGGTSFISLVFEYESNNRAVEFALGTFSGRDLSLAVTGKQYLGGGDLRAFAGAGLWGVAAFPADQRAGFALIARAPIGVDWHALERHAAGFELNLNRALAMRRPDPVDERPPRTRIVPLPALYYRFADPR